MGDERVTDVLRESQSAILKRFCPADVQAAIAPVNVRKREMSDLLAAQAETKQKQHERSFSDVPRRILLTRPEESLYFDLRPQLSLRLFPLGQNRPSRARRQPSRLIVEAKETGGFTRNVMSESPAFRLASLFHNTFI
jgi:hypothetical protein